VELLAKPMQGSRREVASGNVMSLLTVCGATGKSGRAALLHAETASASVQRQLVISHDKPQPEQLYEKYAKQNAELRRRTDGVENARVQEMAISFASGALSLVAFFSIARGFRSSPRAATSRAAPLFADEAVE